MPLTFGVFVVGWLAIAGIPPLSGFFAKDQILAVASETGRTIAWIVALFAAFFSALYVSRIAFLAFSGPSRYDGHPHESPRVMTVPMVLLAIGAVVAGVLGISAVSGILPRFLEPVVGRPLEAHGGLSEVWLSVISVGVALLGIGTGYLVYGSSRIDWVALRTRFWPVHRTLEHGWWFDTIYSWILVTPGKAAAAFAAYVVDRRIVDGVGNLLARGVGLLAAAGRRLQTGRVRNYALAFLLGVVAVMLYVAVKL
jgi:NADH-quinone oxidoreductase subunit L